MRSSVKLFEDQYKFYKELKSKRLLVAFVEYMFEDIEPTDLKGIEQTVFNSLKNRMENSKKITDGNSKGGKVSRGGGRSRKDSGELEGENKSKTSQKQVNEQVKQQLKNNEEEVEVYNNKLLYLDNVRLKQSEYDKLVEQYGKQIIEDYILKLSDYMIRTGKKYTDHYRTILKRLSKGNVKKKSELIDDRDKPYDFGKDKIIYPVRQRKWNLEQLTQK